MPSWMVVMRVTVIHADFATAASTGLFGLLGDAPVLLVDVFDEARIKALWKLAEKCEPRELVTVCQGFLSENLQKAYHQILRDIVNHKLRYFTYNTPMQLFFILLDTLEYNTMRSHLQLLSYK